MRARDIGLFADAGKPGAHNAITDVAGVSVGHCTLIDGEGPLRVGSGPVRTGVTVVVPRREEISEHPLFAGCHRLNGNGELTGLEWVRESGLLTSPIALTNSHSVGVVRDALVRREILAREPRADFWSLPVVGETCDRFLNDIDGQHVLSEHVFAALDSASDGAVTEGCVGAGTGVICHQFKSGIGTSSRIIDVGGERFTVGVLVQANHGTRASFTIDGVPVGRILDLDAVPAPGSTTAHATPPPASSRESGSVIIVVATDAPLLPTQLRRLAQRAGLGLARLGAFAGNYSGDLIIAFSTAAGDLPPMTYGSEAVLRIPVEMLSLAALDPFFEGVVEATEEAVLNALLQAETMVGRDGITAYALEGRRLQTVMQEYRRSAGPSRRPAL